MIKWFIQGAVMCAGALVTIYIVKHSNFDLSFEFTKRNFYIALICIGAVIALIDHGVKGE